MAEEVNDFIITFLGVKNVPGVSLDVTNLKSNGKGFKIIPTPEEHLGDMWIDQFPKLVSQSLEGYKIAIDQLASHFADLDYTDILDKFESEHYGISALPRDVLYSILMPLNYVDTMNYFKTNTEMAMLSEDKIFWRRKILWFRPDLDKYVSRIEDPHDWYRLWVDPSVFGGKVETLEFDLGIYDGIKIAASDTYSVILTLSGEILYKINTSSSLYPKLKLAANISGAVDMAVVDDQLLVLTKSGNVFLISLDEDSEAELYRIEIKGQTFRSIFASGGTFFVVTTDGTLYAAGGNMRSKLGFPDKIILEEFTKILGVENISMVSSGINHTLFLTSDGSVYVSGDNTNGAIGLGEGVSGVDMPTLLYTKGEFEPIGVFVSDNSSFIVMSNGDVFAFGSNAFGELGIIKTKDVEKQYLPERVGLENVHSVFACNGYNLFLCSNGEVYVTGIFLLRKRLSGMGMLSELNKNRYLPPILVEEIRDVVDIVSTSNISDIDPLFIRAKERVHIKL